MGSGVLVAVRAECLAAAEVLRLIGMLAGTVYQLVDWWMVEMVAGHADHLHFLNHLKYPPHPLLHQHTIRQHHRC